MRALFGAEHFGEELAGAVGHQMLFGEGADRVHEAHHLDDALDLVQVAHGRVQRAEQVDGDGARGLLAFVGADVGAELADPDLAVLLGDVARQEHEVAGLHERHVGGGGCGHRGQGNAEAGKLVVNAHGDS
ncbi:hypothetical protein D3C84_1009840 [compost metagenome]